MPDPNQNGLESRVSSLETSVDAIHSDVADIKKIVTTSQRTNWSVVIAGAGLVGAMWLAMIQPLQDKFSRSETDRATLADAVLRQNQRISLLEMSNAKSDSLLSSSRDRVDEIDRSGTRGSTIAVTRLELLEQLRSEGRLKDGGK